MRRIKKEKEPSGNLPGFGDFEACPLCEEDTFGERLCLGCAEKPMPGAVPIKPEFLLETYLEQKKKYLTG
jgi:hypothetical protein